MSSERWIDMEILANEAIFSLYEGLKIFVRSEYNHNRVSGSRIRFSRRLLVANVYKIIVTRPFNSGKTTFVSTISDIAVVTTEKKITTEDRGIKNETTVAMDYGRVEIDGKVLHLSGTPGQTRFNFMWDILAREMNAFVVLVDS